MNRCFDVVRWLNQNKLKLNPEKTQIMLVRMADILEELKPLVLVMVAKAKSFGVLAV